MGKQKEKRIQRSKEVGRGGGEESGKREKGETEVGEVRGEWGDRKKIHRSWGGGGGGEKEEGGRERESAETAGMGTEISGCPGACHCKHHLT